jgi:hypothetical protein
MNATIGVWIDSRDTSSIIGTKGIFTRCIVGSTIRSGFVITRQPRKYLALYTLTRRTITRIRSRKIRMCDTNPSIPTFMMILTNHFIRTAGGGHGFGTKVDVEQTNCLHGRKKGVKNYAVSFVLLFPSSGRAGSRSFVCVPERMAVV